MESDPHSLLTPTHVEEPSDDAVGIESRMRLGRAMKALIDRDPTPVRVGRYRVERRIGSGGMSVVYAAHDAELDRQVAIKLLLKTFASAPGWEERLRREATAMARLGHVNVAHVYEVGEYKGAPFIAMELISGSNLRQWLAERERSVAEIIAIYIQAARGLAAAHEQGLVHRDFKPDNVIVDAHGWARVLDFGLVLTPGEGASPAALEGVEGAVVDSSTSGTNTVPGTVLGTPAYMAPEQMDGEVVDARADQFAFCVALFEALHGERPFPGDSLTQISHSIRSGDVQPIVLASDKVAPPIVEVLARGLCADPQERYASMDALIDALTEASQHRERAQRHELQRRAEMLDFEKSTNTRWQHSTLIGVALASIVVVLYLLRKMGIHQAGYPDAIGFGVTLIVLQRLSERRIAATGLNAFGERWARMLTLASSVVVYSLLFCWLIDLPFNTGLAVTFLAAGSASMSVILFIDARLVISSLFLLATAPALAFAPSLRPLWLIVGLVGAYASLALVWRNTDRPD